MAPVTSATTTAGKGAAKAASDAYPLLPAAPLKADPGAAIAAGKAPAMLEPVPAPGVGLIASAELTHSSGGSAKRQLEGVEPAKSYVPIKDFAKLVKPSGTAKAVFEGEAAAAIPQVAKWTSYLSTEAQEVAKSILEAKNNGELNAQQVYTIVLYTLDVRHAGGTVEDNFYVHLNRYLQMRDMTVLKKLEGYLHYFMSALEALPKQDGLFYRGVAKSAFEVVKRNYKCGTTIHWSGMSSISQVESVSEGFALEEGPIEADDGPGGVVFQITAMSGRKISHLSAIPTESEVLLLPNFRAIVTKSLYRKGKVYAVDICELLPNSNTYVF